MSKYRIKLPKKGKPDKGADTGPLVVRYVARLPDGTLAVRQKDWKKAATEEAIADWMEDYAGRVERGYKPEGFEVPPLPFYARVMRGAKVLAEWRVGPAPDRD